MTFRHRVRVFFLRPIAPDGEGRAGARQPGVDRGNGGEGGMAAVQTTVLALLTQLKKGVPWSACAAPARRLAVFSLVPMR